MTYKMQNISDFRQSYVLGGKRVLLLPGDVIEVEREVSEIFLERVPDDTPVTFTAGRRVRKVDELVSKVQELENEKENISLAKTDEVMQDIGTIRALINDLRSDIGEEIDKVKEQNVALKSIITSHKEKYDNMVSEYEKEKETMNRRLGILKSAMMTMEEEIFGPLDDDSGN